MRKWKVVSISLIVVLAAVGAGFFDFSNYVNPYLPQGMRVPEIPYHLGLDLQGGVHLVYQADLSKVNEAEYDSAMQGLRDVIERRVNFFGVAEPLVQIEGRGEERRLIVEIAGIVDSSEAIALIGQAPFLDFREPKENYDEILQANQQVLETGQGELQDPFAQTGLNGSLLARADVGFDNITQEPLIHLTFNGEGAKLFQEITARNIGAPLAIYLDNQLIQAPVVQTEIAGGQAQITGNYTLQEAQELVQNLNAGAVPVSITLLSQQQVGPTLGNVSLRQSLNAAAIGLAVVVVFMIAFYRLPGLLASLALVAYGVFLLFLFKVLGFTFTLAGIAGFILSLGMAVDANILIFSRMREELKEGKSFGAAVEEGFRRAWPSIRDGNITTLMVALILFWFGSSFVQGFALALSIGILLSMFSAIVITKNFLRLFAHTPLEKARWPW
ncbi:MAG TPA: protein translocase subunit SecD [Candidatus Paceibacterota bacterium]